MIKILHSADWHLDSPLGGFSPEQRKFLRQKMLEIPDRIADIAIRENCQICLLAGDLFDGAYTEESASAVSRALGRMNIPVFIAPGNHDFFSENSPWARELWPGNVHIFKNPVITSKSVPELNCRVYGAGYQSMDCPGLLADFHASCREQYALMVLHGDPTSPASPYCPVRKEEVCDSGLDYVALGHIHSAGRFGAGAGLCAWSGCPMGRGYDETGIKGVLITELEETAAIRFVPLDVPRFYDQSVKIQKNMDSVLESVLSSGKNTDFYRIHLTGTTSESPEDQIQSYMHRYPNLQILDQTTRQKDLWESAGKGSLEGIYFELLRNAMDGQDPETRETLELAARISRQILDGQEVILP